MELFKLFVFVASIFYDSLVLSCLFVRKGLINPNHSLFS